MIDQTKNPNQIIRDPRAETQASSGELSPRQKLAIGAAATIAVVGGLEVIDQAFDGRSETDDLKHYVEGGTPEDMNPDPSKQVIEVEQSQN